MMVHFLFKGMYLYPTDHMYVYSLQYFTSLSRTVFSVQADETIGQIAILFWLIHFWFSGIFRKYKMGDDITSHHYQLLNLVSTVFNLKVSEPPFLLCPFILQTF